MLLKLPLEEASAKVRTGPPNDFDHDADRPIWAGVIPLGLVAGEPVADERVPVGLSAPPYVTGYGRSR